MITCREVLDFIMGYLDGELTPEERASFEEHIAVCPPCVAYIENYRLTVRLGKEACAQDAAPSNPADGDGGGVPEDLVKAILAARRKKGG